MVSDRRCHRPCGQATTLPVVLPRQSPEETGRHRAPRRWPAGGIGPRTADRWRETRRGPARAVRPSGSGRSGATRCRWCGRPHLKFRDNHCPPASGRAWRGESARARIRVRIVRTRGRSARAGRSPPSPPRQGSRHAGRPARSPVRLEVGTQGDRRVSGNAFDGTADDRKLAGGNRAVACHPALDFVRRHIESGARLVGFG